jgi:hypothetical protein
LLKLEEEFGLASKEDFQLSEHHSSRQISAPSALWDQQ